MKQEKILHCPECGITMVYHDMSDVEDCDICTLEEKLQDKERNARDGGN